MFIPKDMSSPTEVATYILHQVHTFNSDSFITPNGNRLREMYFFDVGFIHNNDKERRTAIETLTDLIDLEEDVTYTWSVNVINIPDPKTVVFKIYIKSQLFKNDCIVHYLNANAVLQDNNKYDMLLFDYKDTAYKCRNNIIPNKLKDINDPPVNWFREYKYYNYPVVPSC